MGSRYRTFLCGLPAPTPCPSGGPVHDAHPSGYGAAEEYAGQLLRSGWRQHRCPGCGLWALWRPRQPQPQPPPRAKKSGEPWTVPDGPGCARCQNGGPCPAVTVPAEDYVTWMQTVTIRKRRTRPDGA